ncbi:MAG: SGNH/GDSL hydrolase family protein [Candidatus Nealsonbacteria bacterium]|nr:SGNH/GDSL hydrolase family protein [Candidatus Nealsonbacteria bacterium]
MDPANLLFIGNSHTYYNDMPAQLAFLAAAAGRTVVVDSHVEGGCTLQQHCEQTGAIERIGSRAWDVVVLQEQSTRPLEDPQAMYRSARILHAEIEKCSAETVFYLTWAQQDRPATQDAINEAYHAIAKELGARLAPVGVAWHNAMAANAELILHAADGRHANATGSYLAACVFFAVLLGQSPVGLPGHVEVDGRTLTRLGPHEAGRLQQVAWETVR